MCVLASVDAGDSCQCGGLELSECLVGSEGANSKQKKVADVKCEGQTD